MTVKIIVLWDQIVCLQRLEMSLNGAGSEEKKGDADVREQRKARSR